MPSLTLSGGFGYLSHRTDFGFGINGSKIGRSVRAYVHVVNPYDDWVIRCFVQIPDIDCASFITAQQGPIY